MDRTKPAFTYGEQRVIDMITAAPGGIHCDDIAAALGSTPNSIKVLIKRIRDKGIAIRHPRFDEPHARRKDVPQLYTMGEG